MPELPEVEILARHLAPLLRDRTIEQVDVRRSRVVHSASAAQLKRKLRGARFVDLSRRGKYLVFALWRPDEQEVFSLLCHLGLPGRMHLKPGFAAHATARAV